MKNKEKHNEVDSAMAKLRIGITTLYKSKFAAVINGKPKIFRPTKEGILEAVTKIKDAGYTFDIEIRPLW